LCAEVPKPVPQQRYCADKEQLNSYHLAYNKEQISHYRTAGLVPIATFAAIGNPPNSQL